MKATIGLVVPALGAGGGVPAVADFLCTQIERSQRFHLQIFSLATSSRDQCSLRLVAPSTWTNRPINRAAVWLGRGYTHIGVIGAELEFRRVAPSAALRRAAQQCDLLQVVSGTPAPALTLKGCGKPIVLQVATLATIERRRQLLLDHTAIGLWRRRMTAIIDRCDSQALKIVDAVMVENQWMLKYAKECIGKSKAAVYYAPPGVDCERYAPIARRSIGRGEVPYILFVGRLSDPRKNIVLLCEAYALLCTQLSAPPRLLLAGTGELPPRGKATLVDAGIHGRVTIVTEPPTDVLRKLFREALCLALPSDEEGFGMVVVEAMASGIPVVATRCGGPEEIITHGVDGYLVPRDDAHALALHLNLLCSESLNQIVGEAARRTAVARFSVEAAFQPFLQSYENLLS